MRTGYSARSKQCGVNLCSRALKSHRCVLHKSCAAKIWVAVYKANNGVFCCCCCWFFVYNVAHGLDHNHARSDKLVACGLSADLCLAEETMGMLFARSKGDRETNDRQMCHSQTHAKPLCIYSRCVDSVSA